MNLPRPGVQALGDAVIRNKIELVPYRQQRRSVSLARAQEMGTSLSRNALESSLPQAERKTDSVNDSHGYYEKAKQAYLESVRAKPDCAKAYNELGWVYGRLGQWKEAEEAYRRSIRLKADYAEPHHNLGAAHAAQGQWEDAARAFKAAIRFKPDFATAHLSLALAEGNLGHYARAIKACRQAIRIQPSIAEAHYHLGVFYLAVGDRRSALDQRRSIENLDQNLARQFGRLVASRYTLRIQESHERFGGR